MDNPSNLDGFDGLPLDLWINQFQPHQETPSSVFHHPASQPLRDYSLLTSRTMPVAFPMEDALAQVSQSSQHMNSSILSQYGLSLPSQPEHQHSSHERSAWSHMMSLDQSMGSYGSHDPRGLMQNRYSPLDDLVEKTREESLIKSHAISSFPSHNLSRASFSSSAVGSSMSDGHNNYFQLPLMNPSHEKSVQHLGQLMNLSKSSSCMDKASHALSVVTDMSTLESSGEYSPVSPPTVTAADKLSMSRLNANPGRPLDLLLRDNEDAGSSYNPSLSSTDPTDIFSYFSKMDSCPTELSSHSTQDSKHLMHSLASYNELPSPSDTPLDMTTAISTKTDKTQTALPKLVTSPITFESSAQPLSNKLATGQEKLPLLQTLLNKGKISNDNVNTVSDSVVKQQQLELSISSNIKLIKPLKSTPKKSNFYGRDASLFSFPSQETVNTPSKIVDSKNDDVKEDRTLDKNNLNNMDKSNLDNMDKSNLDNMDKSSLEKCENSFTDAWEQTSQEDTSNLDLSSVDNQNDSSIFPINSSDSSFTSGFSSSLAQSIDSFIEESTRKVVESDTIPTANKKVVESDTVPMATNKVFETDTIPIAKDEKGSLMSSEEVENKDIEMTHNSLDMSCENIDDQEPVDNTEEEFDPVPPIKGKGKPGKGKKRKATGFPAKPKKQPGRKRGRAQNPKAILIPDEHLSTEDAQAEPIVQPLVIPVSKKKRGPPKARAEPNEVTPRRSSSRKSKDNAMRLIELQADSNYSGFRQSDEEQPPEKKSLRSSKKTISNKVATEIQAEVREQDSFEDKTDDDYEMDEEEAQLADKQELIDNDSNKTQLSTERKLGGLKISIKLSGNSSAEIVSGITDSSPVKKKRKVVKKKSNKTKNKLKLLSEELPEDAAKDAEEAIQEIKETEPEEKVTGSLDATEKHMSLIDKYFSSANSATVARQTQKNSTQIKGKKIKKKAGAGGMKLKASKGLKKIDEDTGGKQKSSVKFDLDHEGKTEKGLDKEDADSNTPKFVCGYCPQRYHSKQDLMTHMEDHMMEMEGGKDGAGLDEKKKPIENLGSPAVSRDPRANRGPTNGTTQPANKQNVSDKKGKLVVELDKDFDVKEELAKSKFKCGECGETFTSKPSLLDHVRIHTADKPFECDICHKFFTEIKLLSAHRKTHVPEKLLRCHMCSKAFVDKADLNYHMQSHPKRSGMNLPGKLDLLHKKKKSLLDTQDKSTTLPPKKPTSFASALSGETEPTDKDSTAPLVLLLKRGGETATTPALKSTSSSNSIIGKSISSEAKLTSKPGQIPAPKVKVSVSEIKTKQPETKGKEVDKTSVISLTKSENNKLALPPAKSEPVSLPATSDTSKTITEQTTGECKCKECPECVTRFLQSFE